MEAWNVNGSEDTTAIWVEDENGQRVATIRNCETDIDRARLIAAAPDLLAALEACLLIVDAYSRVSGGDGDIADMNARRAIAKARGGA